MEEVIHHDNYKSSQPSPDTSISNQDEFNHRSSDTEFEYYNDSIGRDCKSSPKKSTGPDRMTSTSDETPNTSITTAPKAENAQDKTCLPYIAVSVNGFTTYKRRRLTEEERVLKERVRNRLKSRRRRARIKSQMESDTQERFRLLKQNEALKQENKRVQQIIHTLRKRNAEHQNALAANMQDGMLYTRSSILQPIVKVIESNGASVPSVMAAPAATLSASSPDIAPLFIGVRPVTAHSLQSVSRLLQAMPNHLANQPSQHAVLSQSITGNSSSRAEASVLSPHSYQIPVLRTGQQAASIITPSPASDDFSKNHTARTIQQRSSAFRSLRAQHTFMSGQQYSQPEWNYQSLGQKATVNVGGGDAQQLQILLNALNTSAANYNNIESFRTSEDAAGMKTQHNINRELLILQNICHQLNKNQIPSNTNVDTIHDLLRNHKLCEFAASFYLPGSTTRLCEAMTLLVTIPSTFDDASANLSTISSSYVTGDQREFSSTNYEQLHAETTGEVPIDSMSVAVGQPKQSVTMAQDNANKARTVEILQLLLGLTNA